MNAIMSAMIYSAMCNIAVLTLLKSQQKGEGSSKQREIQREYS